MTTKTILMLGLGILIAYTLYSCSEETVQTGPATAAQPAVLSQEQLMEKGEHLVVTLGCGDCHSPKIFTAMGPVPDSAKAFSGHPAGDKLPSFDKKVLGSWVLMNHSTTAAVGPWGISYAANITPDATGIGNWSLEQFSRAVREGKAKGLERARTLLPPMPWPSYARLDDEELKAIFAYLQSLPAVSNIVPEPVAPEMP